MAQDAPTELYHTKKFREWIKTVQLPVVDRFEVDMNIQSWELYDKQIDKVEGDLVKRAEESKTRMADVYRLTSIPGISAMGAITLLSRIGDITRFNNPDADDIEDITQLFPEVKEVEEAIVKAKRILDFVKAKMRNK